MKKKVMLGLPLIFILMLAGCDNATQGNDGTDNGDSYAQYYAGTYRNNQNGTVEVVNNSVYDMLLFEGTNITVPYIVGAIKAGTRSTLNFSAKTDFNVGGYVLLRAVKQSEFAAYNDQSRIDHTAMVTYGEGRRFTTDIVSTTDGNYQYTVNNREQKYGLELRKNTPEGDKVAYLTKGEGRRVIKSPTLDEIDLWPVWVAFNNVTKTIVTFTPENDPLTKQQIQPVRPVDDTTPYYFPIGGTANVNFDVSLPYATFFVRNNATLVANFRNAGSIYRAESNYTGIRTGTRETFEVRADGGTLNLNLAMQNGEIQVPVRFQGQTSQPVVENGYVYTIELNLTGTDLADPNSYTAQIVKGAAIDKSALLASP